MSVDPWFKPPILDVTSVLLYTYLIYHEGHIHFTAFSCEYILWRTYQQESTNAVFRTSHPTKPHCTKPRTCIRESTWPELHEQYETDHRKSQQEMQLPTETWIFTLPRICKHFIVITACLKVVLNWIRLRLKMYGFSFNSSDVSLFFVISLFAVNRHPTFHHA